MARSAKTFPKLGIVKKIPVEVLMLNNMVVFHQAEKYPALKFLQYKQQVVVDK